MNQQIQKNLTGLQQLQHGDKMDLRKSCEIFLELLIHINGLSRMEINL